MPAMLRLFRVKGASMQPTFNDGAVLLIASTAHGDLRAGQAVVVHVANGRYIVKRIAQVLGIDVLHLKSDNSATQSRYCRCDIATSDVAGVVVCAVQKTAPWIKLTDWSILSGCARARFFSSRRTSTATLSPTPAQGAKRLLEAKD